ncbi:protein of unknown function DUF177 [Beutenbergia cavernae DSM 12333]|uniref:Metal-binding protein n=1 Tax=Beutenbergia cavernae (strain ATCC BAA-8 / DSM 12333 / CCUG 43141 / JCM 11478 / NBRC 16432 / NCIMB 13614 / HKI 0122) TaxID=471853 RepID=C5C3G4_BEUC1|nr:DUF177 domain-containing protein [Beutenbergia cavernae]ACQ79863.1 protein of unknown function DUF177 [Beutenbergia cavernae DSM 12333]
MDTRSPLVLSTHDLGRRAGSMRTYDLDVPAPDALAIEVVGVPAGSSMHLELRLESVMDGILVTGSADVALAGECVRCLTAVTDELTVPFQELVYYSDVRDARRRQDDDAEGEQVERYVLTGELLDLEQMVRDAVVLALPFQPLCRPDCPGLCPVCGIRLAEAGPDHAHDETDPRWAALVGLLEDSGESPTTT